MKKFFLILFAAYYIICFHAVGNNITRIDSLKQNIASANNIQQKANMANELARLLWTLSPDESSTYGYMAYNLSKSIHNKQTETTSLLYIAVAKFYTGDYDSCMMFSKKAIETSPENRRISTLSFAYNLISLSYKNLGKNQKALQYAKKSYEIRKTTTDTINIAGSIDNIAHIYSDMGQYETALQYALKALDLFIASGDSLEMAKAYAGIANLYFDMDNSELSLKYFLIAKNLLKNYKNTLTYADVYLDIGTIFLKKGNFDRAKDYFNASLQLFKKRKIEEGIAEAYQDLGLCYAGRNNFRQATSYLHKALQIFKTLNSGKKTTDAEISLGKVFLEKGIYDSSAFYLQKAWRKSQEMHYVTGIKKSLKLLSDLFSKTNPAKALHFYKQYISLRDSIEGTAIKMKLAELEAKYETSKKEKKLLKLKLKEKTERVKNQKLIFWLIFIIFIFSGASVFVFFKRKHERKLLIQQKAIAEKDSMLTAEKLKQAQFKARHLENELNFNIKQLTTHSLNMMQRSELLQNIRRLLGNTMNTGCDRKTKVLSELQIKIEHMLNSERDWDLFKMYFENINKSFFANLSKHHPNLTENDLRLSALIKMGLSVKETASILNVSPQSVKNARYRLKHKLNLSEGTELTQFIESIE